jgi:hypothetical protein
VLDDYPNDFLVVTVSYSPSNKDGDKSYMAGQSYTFVNLHDPDYAALPIYRKNNYVPTNCGFDRDGYQRMFDNSMSEAETRAFVLELY